MARSPALTNPVAMRKMDDYLKSKSDKSKVEELKRFGEKKEFRMTAVRKLRESFPKEFGKILKAENEEDIANDNWTEKLRKLCSAGHHSACEPPNNPPPGGPGTSPLERCFTALGWVCFDVIAVVTGLLGLSGVVKLVKAKFVGKYTFDKLIDVLNVDTLLGRIKKLIDTDGKHFLRELFAFIAEGGGFFVAIMDIFIKALVNTTYFERIKIIIVFCAQIVAWTASGGLALLANIALVSSAIYDLVGHLKQAYDGLMEYHNSRTDPRGLRRSN